MATEPLVERDEATAPRALEALTASPLCADLLRALSAEASACDVDLLMQQFARMRRDVESCLEKIVALQLALRELVAYRWPGDVRQLEATVARAADSEKSGSIEARHEQFLDALSAPLRLPTSLRDAERLHIARILDEVRWNKRRAARLLEISRETLYRKIAEYNLKPAAAADTRDEEEVVV